MMKDLKTPLRYPGGKSRATSFLFDDCNMPVNKISAYREPFLGGGSCAFAFTKMYPDIPVWVNDKYYNLYCFWMTLKNDGDRLTKKLMDVKESLMNQSDYMKAHLDYYHVLREGLKNPIDEFDIAWQFYIMNRLSFSGLGETTGSFSKDAVNKDKQNLFSYRIISKLPKFSALMKNWKIKD